jgi:hypothetical protein
MHTCMRARPTRWLLYAVLCATGAACFGGRTRSPAVLDSVPGQAAIEIRLFPELGSIDTSYRWGEVRVDPRAPVCDPVPAPPASWVVERAATRSRYLEALEVALPPSLAGTRRADSGPLPPGADTLGRVLVAAWAEGAGASSGNEGIRSHVVVWAGPENGYPTMAADTASTQLFARECRMVVAGGERFMTEFAIRTPEETLVLLGAVWPFAPDRKSVV